MYTRDAHSESSMFLFTYEFFDQFEANFFHKNGETRTICDTRFLQRGCKSSVLRNFHLLKKNSV